MLRSEEHLESVRLLVYRSFAALGRAPQRDEIADRTGLAEDDVDKALSTLAQQRHLVLGEDGAILMAHPFASSNMGFSVMGQRTLWWGGCAWDSFAIPHLVPDEPSVLIATTCPSCSTPHALTVNRDAPPSGDQVAHLLIPVARTWDDVVRTCGHQRIYCSEACVSSWLTAMGYDKGALLDLPTLWRLARHWYDGRLDSPYRRREPAESSDYFRQAGLSGAFWGL